MYKKESISIPALSMPCKVNTFLCPFVLHFAVDLAILLDVVLVGIFMEMWSEIKFFPVISGFPLVNFRGNILLINPAKMACNGGSVHLSTYVGELRRKSPIA